MYTESSEEELKQLQKYGFGSLRSGVFSRLQVRPHSGWLRGAAHGAHILCLFPTVVFNQGLFFSAHRKCLLLMPDDTNCKKGEDYGFWLINTI